MYIERLDTYDKTNCDDYASPRAGLLMLLIGGI